MLCVLPSAPEYRHSDTQMQTFYPVLADDNSNVRLNRISDIEKEIENEANHYRQVTQKYRKAYLCVHWSAVSLGVATAAHSSTVIATLASGFAAPASISLGGVAALTGVSSTGLTAFGKNLQTEVTKHEKIYTLAFAKLDSVRELVSKALKDNKISDIEFNIIVREVQKIHDLKANIRTNWYWQNSEKTSDPNYYGVRGVSLENYRF